MIKFSSGNWVFWMTGCWVLNEVDLTKKSSLENVVLQLGSVGQAERGDDGVGGQGFLPFWRPHTWSLLLVRIWRQGSQRKANTYHQHVANPWQPGSTLHECVTWPFFQLSLSYVTLTQGSVTEWGKERHARRWGWRDRQASEEGREESRTPLTQGELIKEF